MNYLCCTDTVDRDGVTPVELAAKKKKQDVVDYLITVKGMVT